jgi:diguanylate cyclase (GGDEF)-like protein
MERVLFVDDSRLMRFAATRFLGAEFDVVLAENGLRAWELLSEDPQIAVVITDLIMPEVDGVELIHRIRCASEERIRTLPILAVTSMEESRGRRLALDAGANDLVPKPFSGTDLIEPAREYLRRSIETMMHPARPPNLRPTRAALIDTLEQVASYHDRTGDAFSLVHLRVDNHAAISARHGGKWGESLMRHVERVVAREVRLEDSVGRSSSDVLTMILMSTDALGAKRLRDRLRDHLAANPARLPGRTLAIRTSFSVQCPDPKNRRGAEATLIAGLDRLSEPANVTRLADRFSA